MTDKEKCKHKWKGIYWRGKILGKPSWIRIKNIYICEECLEVRRLNKL